LLGFFFHQFRISNNFSQKACFGEIRGSETVAIESSSFQVGEEKKDLDDFAEAAHGSVGEGSVA
jgi:hypothetical protein